MNDMSSTIVAKSDQINAADLIGAPRTITIKEVRIKAGDDQPVSVLIEGDQKAFRPCKGVRRLMVRVWGADASKYIGHSMTLFCDPSVTWAGKEEGGIRVSHMTGLDEEIIEYMRTSRAATKPYKIRPLKAEPDKASIAAEKLINRIGEADAIQIASIIAEPLVVKQRAWLATNRPEIAARIDAAIAAKSDDDDPFAEPETRPTTDHGDQYTTEDVETADDLSTRCSLATTEADIAAIDASLETAGLPVVLAGRVEDAVAAARKRLGVK